MTDTTDEDYDLKMSRINLETKIYPNPFAPINFDNVTTHQLRGLARGISCCFQGLRFITQHPQLIPLMIIPVVINTLTVTLAISLSLGLGVWWVHDFSGGLPDSFWAWTKYIGLMMGVFVASLFFTFMVWVFMRATVSAWFESKLAEATAQLIGIPLLEDDTALWRYILETLVLFGGLFVINVLLLLLNFVPFIGSAVALILGYYVNSWGAGWQYFGLALEQRGMSTQKRFQFSLRHHGDMVGAGAWVMLLGLIPIIGPVTLSGTVVGSVLLTSRLWQWDVQHGFVTNPDVTVKH